MSDPLADQIKAQINVGAMMDYLGLPQDRMRGDRQGKWSCCCPFHGEKTPSFHVDEAKGLWHCFGACPQGRNGGDIFKMYAIVKNTDSFPEALTELAPLAGLEYRPGNDYRHLYKIVRDAAVWYYKWLVADDEFSAPSLDYLMNKRGLKRETIQKWGLGYAAPSYDDLYQYLLTLGHKKEDMLTTGVVYESSDKTIYDTFADRIIYPIVNRSGKVCALAGRSADQEPKYKNTKGSPIYSKKATLYGLHLAKEAISLQKNAVIVEGYHDAIVAWQEGVSNVVAACGSAVTPEQVEELLGLTTRITIALDSDDAGHEGMMSAIPNLLVVKGKVVDLRIATMPEGSDPDEMLLESSLGKEGFVNLTSEFAEAAFTEFVRYHMRLFNAQRGKKTLAMQQALADKLAAYAVSSNKAVERSNLADLRGLLGGNVDIATPKVKAAAASDATLPDDGCAFTVLGYKVRMSVFDDKKALEPSEPFIAMQRWLSKHYSLIDDADFVDVDYAAVWRYVDTEFEIMPNAASHLTTDQISILERSTKATCDYLVMQTCMLELKQQTTERQRSMIAPSAETAPLLKQATKEADELRMAVGVFAKRDRPILLVDVP